MPNPDWVGLVRTGEGRPFGHHCAVCGAWGAWGYEAPRQHPRDFLR